jgi:hypothetical protein
MAYCTIKRGNTSGNFNIDRPWEWPTSRINSLENKIGKELNAWQVDNPDTFPVGVSFWYVPIYSNGGVNHQDSLLTVIKRDDGISRQTLTSIAYTYSGGGSMSARIYSRSGTISSSLAWTYL